MEDRNMGMLKKIGEISINTLSTIMEMTKEPGMKAIEKTVITAAPLIIKTIKKRNQLLIV